MVAISEEGSICWGSLVDMEVMANARTGHETWFQRDIMIVALMKLVVFVHGIAQLAPSGGHTAG